MTSPPSTEVFSSPRLAGFWQFTSDGAPYVGVFETDADGDDGKLSAGRIRDGQLEGLRAFASAGPEVRAIEACASGPDLLFALELNRDVPAETARLPLTAVTDSGKPSLTLEASSELKLSPAQIAAVRLPVTEYWNVPGPLRPEAWVFSSRPICGSQKNEVIANTADGQAAVLATDDSQGESPLIPEAAQPQAWRRNGQLMVAFMRFTEPYRPFWALSRYSGSRPSKSGSLFVAGDRDRPVDLSATLAVGPVSALALVIGADGADWLFASRSGQPTELFGITRRNGAWAVAQKWSLDCPADRIAVEKVGQGWQVVAAAKTPDGWTLRQALLQGSP